MAEDYFDYVLDGLPDTETTNWKEICAVLERSQAAQTARLEEELRQIEQQLTERDQIRKSIVAELEGKIDRYSDRLDHLYTIGKGRTDGTREQLKERLVSFYRELRDEHRAHWRDRQDLEQERRAVLRELEEAQDTTLSDLL